MVSSLVPRFEGIQGEGSRMRVDDLWFRVWFLGLRVFRVKGLE
jgi:hypothetical protein